MGKRNLVWGVLGLFLLVLSATAFAGGVEIATYEAGAATAALITNTVGEAVTGLHIEFDQEVTIVNKIEFGGYLPLLGEMTGTSFDFAGGDLVAGGTIELDWEPAEATPVLIQWISGASPIGAPYFTTVEVMGRLLGEGIVAARENDPAQLQAAFAQFFADNAEFFVTVSESLGMPLEDSLMPIIMTAPAEGIANFFNTLVGMLGATSLEDVTQGSVDFTALFALLGI
ncbi:MAG: hypothetical protein U9N00_04770 [Candidatus Bipolaricaulota bacterium]|nr:hypothetical protein [Candidatus Bipolaricaulota bacterium]